MTIKGINSGEGGEANIDIMNWILTRDARETFFYPLLLVWSVIYPKSAGSYTPIVELVPCNLSLGLVFP